MAVDLAFLTSDASVLAGNEEIVPEMQVQRARLLALALLDRATPGKGTLR
jgi:hypothetical protein